MPKYEVIIGFSGSTKFIVDADDEEEAGDIAAQLWEDGEDGEETEMHWTHDFTDVAPVEE